MKNKREKKCYLPKISFFWWEHYNEKKKKWIFIFWGHVPYHYLDRIFNKKILDTIDLIYKIFFFLDNFLYPVQFFIILT
jgi:hypothetical protein